MSGLEREERKRILRKAEVSSSSSKNKTDAGCFDVRKGAGSFWKWSYLGSEDFREGGQPEIGTVPFRISRAEIWIGIGW